MNQESKPKAVLFVVFSVLIGLSLGSFLTDGIEKILAPGAETPPLAAKVVQLIPPEDDTPKYFYVNKNTAEPKVSAKAYLVGDLNTGEVILSKNGEQKFPIASVSKLMTALIASSIGPDETAVVSKRALSTLGQNGELRLGEKIKVKELVYPLLLESSNDAAEVLAEHFGRENFIKKMNETAASLKMFGTTYDDPSGLSAKNQSTPLDMFKLAGFLWRQKPELLEITSERSYTIKKKHGWSNISQFLREPGYKGGKSGYTDSAKQTVVSVFSLPLGETGERPIGIALLQSNDRKKDVDSILKYLKKNVYYGGSKDAATNWVEEKVKLDIREPDFVTLTFGGDIMMDRGVKNSVLKNFNNDYSELFTKSKDLAAILKRSDIVFGNLEGPVSNQGKDMGNLYAFRMDPAVIPALKGAGFEVVSLANNHIGDWGRPALNDTLARLKENEILYTGAGYNKSEAEEPAIIEKYSMKIGFLAFSDKGPQFMKAGESLSGILLASDPRFEEIIKNASLKVDHLIVSFHFGEEYKDKHDARQTELAHKAIDSGAKLVIGHHPHWVQDFEIYKNGYIAYSLGNLLFDQSWSQKTMQGMLLEVKLWRDGSLWIRKHPTTQNRVFQIEKVIQGKEEKINFPKTN